jgi:hypothetical protein
MHRWHAPAWLPRSLGPAYKFYSVENKPIETIMKAFLLSILLSSAPTRRKNDHSDR